MRVPLRELPEGHALRVLEGPAEDYDLGEWIEPVGPVRAALDLDKRGDQVTVRGQVAVAGAMVCSRCAKPFPAEIAAELLVVADGRGSDSPEDEAALEEEGSILYHDGLELDLGGPIREALILEVPAAPLCREDCRGLCPRCGQDWNESPCGCPRGVGDARWNALSSLEKTDREG